jgi:NADPH:quinone reductase-like Zn-dependent oxidoreductase
MKALQMLRYGAPPEVVELADVPEPAAPGAGEVLVAVEYAPINNSELLKITNRYPIRPASFPSGVGNEGVARILSVGSGVTGLKPGDRVLVPTGVDTWRERILLPAASLLPLPPRADPQQLSMLSINPPTAALLLSEYVDLTPGDWVLQNAANSGVGRSVIAIARDRGVRTVNIVRRAELVDDLISQGADVVLVDGPDLAARVAKSTANAGIKLALDGIAGDGTAVLCGCLAPGGTVVLYAVVKGALATTSAFDLIFRDVAVRGFWLYRPPFKENPKVVEAMKQGARLIAEGKLRFPVTATYPLTSASAALANAQKGGKVLFKIAA